MSILFQINVVVNSGSTGRIAEEIGQIAIAAGWKSYIAYARSDRPSSSELIKIGTDWDIKLHGLQTRFLDRHGLASKKATRKLIKQINEIKPDVIHLHNIHGYYLNYQLLFEYLSVTGIPIIWTLHDCWSFTGHCSHFTFVGCERWKVGCFDCPQQKNYPASFFIDRSKANYQDKKKAFNLVNNLTLVPVSNWLLEITAQSFIGQNGIRRIYNGINSEIFSPKDNNREVKEGLHIDKPFMVIGVANGWSQRKGLNDFIQLRSKLPEEYSIVLVGLSKRQIQALPNGIIGISRTESIVQLAELYSAADVFVNPTWEDNFPTTNIEALACGTPIITYQTGGSVEAVSDETGIVVAQGDLIGLVKAIHAIKENGKSFYTKACRDRAVTHFNKEDRYQEYLDLYNQLLKNKK